MLPAIEIENISKSFKERSWRTVLLQKEPERVEALKGISLVVQPGEVFGLLGPNGAGKTTLIKILATLILPDVGTARICDYEICNHPRYVRQVIGLVNTNERSFYWRLTGRQNLSFFASLCNIPKSIRIKRLEGLLDLVGLGKEADTLFMKYSTGQRQRLAVARALLVDPMVLLMDEPTNSLDPVVASKLRKLTREDVAGKQGKSVLWCTHNLKEAEEVCDRLAIIHKGKIIAMGSLDQVRSLIGDERLYQLKIGSCSQEALKETGISPVQTFRNNGYVDMEFKEREENIPFLLNSLVGNGIRVYSIKRKEADLEEIFEKLIHREN